MIIYQDVTLPYHSLMNKTTRYTMFVLSHATLNQPHGVLFLRFPERALQGWASCVLSQPSPGSRFRGNLEDFPNGFPPRRLPALK